MMTNLRMESTCRLIFLLSSLLLFTLFPSTFSSAAESKLNLVRLPRGFAIEVYQDRLPGARSLALGARGTLFVGTRGEGKVYAVTPYKGNERERRVYVLADGLEMPNGVAFRNGSLYVAEVHRVLRFDDIENRLAHPPRPVVVNDSFPARTHHGWKFILFGPDGKLYVPVGAPCSALRISSTVNPTIAVDHHIDALLLQDPQVGLHLPDLGRAQEDVLGLGGDEGAPVPARSHCLQEQSQRNAGSKAGISP